MVTSRNAPRRHGRNLPKTGLVENVGIRINEMRVKRTRGCRFLEKVKFRDWRFASFPITLASACAINF
jgi:hypothetical protein